MTHQPNDPANARKGPASGRSPMRFVMPIVLGLAVGSAIYGGYYYWSHYSAAQQALAAAPGDTDMAKPSADECAVAHAALTAIHAAGSDTAWRTSAGASKITLVAKKKKTKE